MTIRVAIDHQTVYRYARPTLLSPHLIRLRPAPHSRTPIEHYQLAVEPKAHFINWQQDPFGNYLARLVFTEKTRELKITVSLVAEMTVTNPFDFFVEAYAENHPFKYAPQLGKELLPYLEIKEDGPRLKHWLDGVEQQETRAVDFLVQLNQRLWQDIRYGIRLEPGIQSCEKTLERKNGSCRDSAWLLVQILRHLGLAARFVSGYLVQLTADEKSLDGPSGPEADFTDLHAWAEAYIPGAGWVGLDPTSGMLAGEGHIPLACTPDPESAAPVTGNYVGDSQEVTFDYHNRVRRIHEDPRVTKPYSDAQWAAIDHLGRQVDRRLEDRDVRLTMGGEPTFVSIDDMDHPQWNTQALGEHKAKLAADLLLRLRERFAPNGLLHFGQGKWYPGEQLPRWASGLFWRRDGKPLWRDPALMAAEERDYAQGPAEAERLVQALARELSVESAHIHPAYEDLFYALWREGTLPDNLDPADNRLRDPLERGRLRRLFEQGLDQVIGYALPLSWDHRKETWRSVPWRLRRQHLFLIPDESAMGYRLPLDSLPWEPEAKQEFPHPQDLFEHRPPLGDTVGEVARRFDQLLPAAPARRDFNPQGIADDETQADAAIRTALCVEPRHGRLHVFLPPLAQLEHFLALTAAVERAAASTGLPVRLEGYPPPRDPRINQLLITPDPGVIEVNVHPAHSWGELLENTQILYEEARLSRLGTEKFLVDGRHTGTGGGNHLTIGGPAPADSPLLRRPDLLRSLITFWQHHPGLSYLFSGLFVGPTSQAPRVDEGRDSALYELEIAFRQIPEGEVPAPWLVDRLLRNLLVDITGNTHRAEFCIDKLYSPDSAAGRLGILELRAFEMPPHPRMTLVQALLVRTLIARFWEQPYSGPLVRWGTELHDRWLLPHFVQRDLQDVADQLNRAGLPFQRDWLAPFYEFRFPHYGTIQAQDIALELRQAIEPWSMLGEEVTAQGAARFVDSSLERLQVKLSGLTDGRHVLTCNGVRVPLRSTGAHGEYVAGVRFRAWQPPSGLHPAIGIHAPLKFDLVDTWNHRSIGGCTYHVTHPGGRSFDTAPVNAFEAESRRIARFWNIGYSKVGERVQVAEPTAAECHPQYPYTLDMRRVGIF